MVMKACGIKDAPGELKRRLNGLSDFVVGLDAFKNVFLVYIESGGLHLSAFVHIFRKE